MTTSELLGRVQRLRTERTPFVLATVVRAQRPTSAKAGDSALVLADGTVDGFVGGSCAESTVRLQGLRLLSTGESTLLRITPSGEILDDGAAEGLVTVANPCLSGGTLEIFLEAMLPPPLVHVFGDAPVAQALARLGGALGYDVVTGLDREVRPDACAVVVASHGRDEEPVLRAALDSGVPYVALVASRRRGASVLSTLDIGGPERARVHSPAGLDIGARTAPEVALSILAEIVASRPKAPVAVAPAGPAVGSAVDPVCGMAVAVTPTALQHEHAGKTWYFCGSGCRDAFADSPERYA
ncbi:MAG: xanthine dehydrogenase accessory factor [Micromonosporaceae bacterium]